MSGLAALLDDIAALVKLAAASVDDVAAAAGRASAKAAGVVVDDTAVTPQYVRGVDPARELPIIWKITRGSLINKLVFILPAILLLSYFLPWALIPLLMIGGLYLSFEGAEKLWHLLRPSHAEHSADDEPAALRGPEAEKKVVSGAVRTDFILSAEIMVISMNDIAASEANIWMRALVLAVVAVLITVVVYGIVGIIVKVDDLGLSLAQRKSAFSQKVGLALVKGMPGFLNAISFIGMIAMLWVGGHILLVNLAELGHLAPEGGALRAILEAPYGFVHGLETPLEPISVAGPVLAWLVNTLCSAVIGFVVGSIVMGVIHVLPFGKKDAHGKHEADAHDDETTSTTNAAAKPVTE